MELMELERPKSVAEAVELLHRREGAKVLAGGTDLVLELKRGKLGAETIVSLRGIEELKSISEEENNIVFGSMTTFSNLKRNELTGIYFPSIVQCAKYMGSPQIRNMATIGGNIANGASAADIVPCLISLQARMKIKSFSKERIITVEEYFNNFSENKLKREEIITDILIDKNQGRCGFYKLGKRNSLAISRVNACIWLKVNNDKIEDIALTLGAVGRYPFRVKELEQEAIGKEIEFLFSKEACFIVEKAVFNSIKGRKTMPFKKEAVKGVYKEALRRALGGDEAETQGGNHNE